MPIAYSYVRFSTLEQKKGDSLRRQQEMSEAYAKQHGLILDRTLNLNDEGVSAFSGRNRLEGRLGAFLRAVRSGHIDRGSYLLVESLDRLSRQQVLDALTLFMEILKHEITIVTLADGMVYSNETIGENSMGLLLSLLVMTRAHEESATKSRRVKEAWAAKRTNIGTKKLTSRCPLWMKLNEERTQFEFIPERVETVRTMIRWSAEGMGQAQIAKRLNEQRVPGFSDPESMWQPSYVNKILTSTALFGQMQPKVWDGKNSAPTGEPVENYYPAIISESEFRYLQAVRAKRRLAGGRARKGSDMPNLFSGLVKCAYCGSSMVLATAPGPRKTSSVANEPVRPPTKYLVCDGARRGNGCFAVQWNYKSFETSFLEYCKGVDFAGLLDQISGAGIRREKRQVLNEQLESAKSERTEKLASMTRLLELVEVGDVAPALEISQRIQKLSTEVREIEEEIRQIEQEIQTLDRQTSPDDGVRMFRDFTAKLNSLAEDERFRWRVAISEQIKQIVRKIDLHPAGRLVDIDTAERMREQMLTMGFDVEHVENYMKTEVRTQPRRQGRGGRGRYESVTGNDRIFVIYTHGEQMRIVRPTYDDPFGLVVGHDWVDIENTGNRKS